MLITQAWHIVVDGSYRTEVLAVGLGEGSVLVALGVVGSVVGILVILGASPTAAESELGANRETLENLKAECEVATQTVVGEAVIHVLEGIEWIVVHFKVMGS